jgi:hypothetical protein
VAKPSGFTSTPRDSNHVKLVILLNLQISCTHAFIRRGRFSSSWEAQKVPTRLGAMDSVL